MELVSMIFAIIGATGTIVGIFVSVVLHKKDKQPKIVLSFSPTGTVPSSNDDNDNEKGYILNGYFKKHREFDESMIKFLKDNNFYKEEFFCQHFVGEICAEYNSKNYFTETNYYPTCEIRKIVRKFEKNPDFIEIINKYMMYQKCSKWVLYVRNEGESNALNFKIDFFKENNSGGIFLDGILKKECSRKIILYYFDEAMIIDKNNCNYWKDGISTIFYLVKEEKYNNKDERLFLITYDDMNNKHYKLYCCAKIGKNKNLHIMGAD